MADEESVYLHFERQIGFALVGAVEHHRRVMERREVDPAEVDVIVGLLIGDGKRFVKDRLPCRRRDDNDAYCHKQ